MADCLFCSIIDGSVPSDQVPSSPRTFAFRDLEPQAPTHVLIVPRRHYPTAADLAAADGDLLAQLIRDAHAIATDAGLEQRGYRLAFNTGPDAQQSVQHVHLHLLGGRSFTWPPG